MRHCRTILMMATLFAVTHTAVAQQSSQALPRVVEHSEPTYPPLARQARIEGEVRVKISTDGESVRMAEAETGHPLLRRAAEDNTRTWKFVAHPPGTFEVTFQFKVLSNNLNVEFLQSPALVEVAACPPKVIVDYASIGLGTWKAQMESAHGKISKVLELSYSGRDGDWLSVDVAGSRPQAGEVEEIGFGHREGNLLTFTKAFSQPDGQQLKTLFVGKMSGDKIVGTSVDDAGIMGEWTAVRVADSPKPRQPAPHLREPR